MKKVVLWFLLALLGWPALADADLEIGFGGNIVANHWNSIKLTTRDEQAANLIINIDQGNLRNGENLISYSFSIARSRGIAIFENDIFIPKWQKFTWALKNDSGVLASGSFDRRQANPQKLSLIISANPSIWLNKISIRSASVAANSLTKRLASYDGISTIVIDGTAAAPKAENLIVAATSGVQVSLIEPLPSSHSKISALAPEVEQRLGAGYLIKTNDFETSLASTNSEMIVANFVKNNSISPPKPKQQMPIFFGLSIFAILVLALMSLGQKAAVLTSISLSLLTAILAWTYLQPKETQIASEQSLQISSGELAKELKLTTIFTLSGGEISLPNAGYMLEHVPFKQQDESTIVITPRWSAIKYSHKPSLSKALLLLSNNQIQNRSNVVFSDVFIKGIGFLDDLKPGTSSIMPQEDHRLPKIYEGIIGSLEDGTAIARYGNNVLIAFAQSGQVSQ